jgi:hypothetical protein
MPFGLDEPYHQNSIVMFTSKISSAFLSLGIIICLSSCDPGSRNSTNNTISEDSTSQLGRRMNESDRSEKNSTINDENKGLEWRNVEIPVAVRRSIGQDSKFQEKEIVRTMTSIHNGRTLYLVTFKSDSTRYVFDEQGKLQPTMDFRE